MTRVCCWVSAGFAEALQGIYPELLLSGSALLLLLLDVFLSRGLKKIIFFLAILSIAGAAALTLNPVYGEAFGLLAIDPFAVFFKLLALLGCFFALLLSKGDSRLLEGNDAGVYAALLLLSTVGTMLLGSVRDLLLFLVGLELTTLPLFILAAFLRDEEKSAEGALKFFLMGAVSTGIMIFGISYLYGLVGSTHFEDVRRWMGSVASPAEHALFIFAILLFIVGVAFKLTLVPFHQWAPDAYQGSPTPITAFFSISRDAGVLAVALRFLGYFLNLSDLGLVQWFTFLAVATMTVANLTAIHQKSVKRLLAYSSIAHAGNLMVGFVAGNALGYRGIMLYALAYLLMNFGSFAIVALVERSKGTDDLDAFSGLAGENLTLALLMLFFLLSLAGIPPFLGFWGKFYVFSAAIEAKMYGLVVLSLLNAVVAVYYYFRIVQRMFFESPAELRSPVSQGGDAGPRLAALLACAGVLALGIFPDFLFTWIHSAARLLP